MPVPVRAVRLGASASQPSHASILVILPDGRIVRPPESLASISDHQRRDGRLMLAALPSGKQFWSRRRAPSLSRR